MDNLHWPLSVLSRAVHFKNLTGASVHVGLSQPQLSRLVSQLESEFSVTLLDRTAKRKSTWTEAALKLAEIYSQNSRKLQGQINEALVAQVPHNLNIGTLEGLSPLAIKASHALFQHKDVHSIELDVFDQNDLEKRFFNGDLDIIFTVQYPSKQKYKYAAEIGYQSLETIKSSSDYLVLSPYERGRLKKKPSGKVFVSNSLMLRKTWLQEYGGQGTMPSTIQKGSGRNLVPVLMIAPDHFNLSLWNLLPR